MFKKLILKDFQSHKDSEINFSPGVNTIIGTSDHGKSSIFRALSLICKNKPDGNHFVSHWLLNDKGKIKGNTHCILYVDDHIIERKKGKVNEYKIDDVPLRAFQRDVPEEVLDALNLLEPNFQHQSDNFFLLNLPSTKVAEELNKIVNLEIIDLSVASVNQKLRNCKQDFKTNQELIQRFEDELTEYDNIQEQEYELEKLITLDKQLYTIKTETKNLNRVTNLLKNFRHEINCIEKNLPPQNKMETLISLSIETQSLQKENESLISQVSHGHILLRHLAKCRSLQEISKKISKLIALNEEKNRHPPVGELLQLTQKIRATEKNIDYYTKEIETLESNYKKTMPDICPVCQRPINDEVYFNSRQSLSV